MSKNISKKAQEKAIAVATQELINKGPDDPIMKRFIKSEAYDMARNDYAQTSADLNEEVKMSKILASTLPLMGAGLAAVGALPGLTAAGAVASILPVSVALLAGGVVAKHFIKKNAKKDFEGSENEKIFNKLYSKNPENYQFAVNKKMQKVQELLKKSPENITSYVQKSENSHLKKAIQAFKERSKSEKSKNMSFSS